MPAFEQVTSALPPLYAAWMGELLAGPLPQEKKATCERCAMCSASPEQSSGAALLFNPKFN